MTYFIVGVITRPDGSKEIVVTTGYEIYETKNTTEILNLDTLTWRSGPEFPVDGNAFYGASAPYKDSFLAMSGYRRPDTPGGAWTKVDEVWYFDPSSDEWVLKEGRLETPREHFIALTIPDDACTE